MTVTVPAPGPMLIRGYADGLELVLLFDYDGTLVPIADHPSLARPCPELLATLMRLTRLPGVHLGVISGRPHLQLRELFPIPGLFLAGTSGLELDFHGVSVVHPEARSTLPLLRDVAELLDSLSQQFTGTWLERKPIGLTLHFRHAAASEAGRVRALALEILGQHHRRLRVVDGPLALEITPRLGWTKGTAVRLFLDALPLRSRLVLYAGDHANDLDAIEAVEGLAGITIAGTANGGITIGIGEHAPPVAKFRMDSPRQFAAWLTDLETALRGQVT